MRNKVFLSRAIVTLFAIFSIFAFSTAAFAVSEYELDTDMTVTVENTDSANDTYSIEKMSKDNDDNPSMGQIIVVAVVAGAVVTGIAVFLIYRSYKTNGMTEPYPYNQKAPLQLTEANDVLVDTRVTKVRINKD